MRVVLKPQLVSFYKTFSAAAGITVAVFGAMALVGWALDIQMLKSVSPHWVSIKPNTAVAFMLLGAALYMLQDRSPKTARRTVQITAQILAAIASLIGFMSLIEYAMGWNLGIDQLLFKEPAHAIGTANPGQMAPVTAACLIVLGISLLHIDLKKYSWYSVTQWLAIAAGVIGLLGVVGYAYGVRALYELSSYTDMAFPTAAAFIILSAGIVFARPDRGFLTLFSGDSPGGIVVRWLLVPTSVFTLLMGWVILTGSKAGYYSVEHGMMLFAVLVVIVFAVLVWRTSASLHQEHIRRKQIEEDLASQSEELTAMNEELASQSEELASTNQELLQANDELSAVNQKMQQANETLHLVNDTATHFLAGATLDHSLETMLATAKRLIGSDAASIAVFDYPDIVKTWVYDLGGEKCGVIPQVQPGLRLPGLAAKYSEGVVIIDDMDNNLMPQGHIQMENVLAMRIDALHGWALLLLANKDGGFVEEDAGKISTLGQLSSIIIDRAAADENERQAMMAAEERAAEKESFISNMADGVVQLDIHGHCVYMNEAGREILGIPPSEGPGAFFDYKRYTLDDEPMPLEQVVAYHALQGKTIRNIIYKIVSPWGKAIIIDTSASPIRDSKGRIIGATNVFRDVTERVDFERQRQELYEREHRIADLLQQALIPPQITYEFPGCRAAVKYQPALREAEVGGDFYDVFELDGGRVGILIGDVAGKGLMAAMRVAAARYAIRSYAFLDPNPSRVLTLANEALSREDIDNSGMLTAFYALVDMNERTITYANAGHEPPLLKDSRGGIEELYLEGRALGVMGGFAYPEVKRELQPGDQIVMFTDGITEARAPGPTLFDKEGVVNCLRRYLNAPAEMVAFGLLNAAARHAGGHLQDDAAIVVFEMVDKPSAVKNMLMDLTDGDHDLPLCRDAVLQAAAAVGFPESDQWAITSAVFEACVNALTHGAGSGKGYVSLAVQVNNGALEAVVSDSGSGHTCPIYAPIPPASSQRGRGIPLMKTFMDEVRFESEGGCKVTLIKRLPPSV